MIELDKIYNTDCLEALRQLPDKCVDLVVTDPPYDMGQGGGGGAFGTRKREYRTELKPIMHGYETSLVLEELVRVMKRTNIYIWSNKDQIADYYKFFDGCSSDMLTWHKTNPTPACNGKYLPDTEYLLFFKERGVPVYGSYETKRKFYVTPSNKKDKEQYGHPTIKPIEIIKNLIINSSKEGDIVLDPFMGSGTTAVAAKQLNRHFIGYEIDKTYYDIALKRIAEQQTNLFDNK